MYNCRVRVTGSDGSSAEDDFTITVGDAIAGRFEQANLTFVVGRRARTTRLARVNGGPSGAVYEYSISGAGPSGMTLNASQVSGTPSRIQITRHTLTARSVTTGGATIDPNAPYTATFTISVISDPTVRGIELRCVDKNPVGSDAQGRPIYEYFVGEQAGLRWFANNLNTRDGYTYEVLVTGGGSGGGVGLAPPSRVVGAGIFYQTPVFNDRVSTNREAGNPFSNLNFYNQPPLKQNRVNSAGVHYTGTPERTWRGRFFHSAGHRTLNVDYWPLGDENVEPFMRTGLNRDFTIRGSTIQIRSGTPTRPTEAVYRADLIQRRGDPEYCGVSMQTFDRNGNQVLTDPRHPLIQNGLLLALFEEHRSRRINYNLRGDARNHEIRVRWIPSVLRWEEEQGDIELEAGDSVPTLGGATGGTLPYKYSLHGVLPSGITSTPSSRTNSTGTLATSADPPLFAGTVGTDEIGYYGIYEMCEDSSPTPQVIFRLVGITVS